MKFRSCPPLPGVSVGLALPWTPPRPAGPRLPTPSCSPPSISLDTGALEKETAAVPAET